MNTRHLPTENRKQTWAPRFGALVVYKQTPKNGCFWVLPLTSPHKLPVSCRKQHAEPLISPEEMGSCLEATERLKNSLAHVVLHTRNEQKTVSNKGVEVKASKGVRSMAKGRKNGHNK